MNMNIDDKFPIEWKTSDTTEQRHGLGLLIVKQIMKGHNEKILIGHTKAKSFA